MDLFSLIACPPLAGAGRACVRNMLPHHDCQACVHACPTGAITTVKGKIEIDTNGCTSCGACLYACPATAIEGISPALRHFQGNCLVMPLSRCAPSTGELLMWHAEYKIRAVEMDMDAHPAWLVAIAILNNHLKQFGEAVWNILPPPSGENPGARRQWLHIKNSSCQTGSVTAGVKARRASFPQVTEHHVMLDRERCTLCGACARICPESVIEISNTSFTLNAERCTGCNNCEVLCFEKAISIEKAISVAEETQAASRFFEIAEAICTTCRHSFFTWSAEEIQCPVCRKHRFNMREA